MNDNRIRQVALEVSRHREDAERRMADLEERVAALEAQASNEQKTETKAAASKSVAKADGETSGS